MAEIKKSYVNDLMKLSVNGDSFLNALIDELLINGTINSNSRVMTVSGSKMMSCLHPGHSDNRASFGIDLDTGTSNCFGGCGSTNPHGTLLLLLDIDTKTFPTYGKQISEVIKRVKETFKNNQNFISQLTQIERETKQKSKNWNNNIFDVVLNNFEATNKAKKDKLNVEINKRLDDRKASHLYGDEKIQISPQLESFQNQTLLHVLVKKELTKRIESGEIKTFKDLLNTGFFTHNKSLNIDMTFNESETLEKYVERLEIEDDDVILGTDNEKEERTVENLVDDILENKITSDIPVKFLDFVREPGLVFPIKEYLQRGTKVIEKNYGLVFKPDYVHNENFPKYKNIMNPEYKKGDHFLFQENLFFQRKSKNTIPLNRRRTWITEGVFDGVSLNSVFSNVLEGIENVVITSAGATLTENQIKKVENSVIHQNFEFKNQNLTRKQQNQELVGGDVFFKTDNTPAEIVVSLDFDKAGYIGSLRAITDLLKKGLLKPSEVKSISKLTIENLIGEKLNVKDLDDLLKNKKVRKLFENPEEIKKILEDPHTLASRVSIVAGIDLLQNKNFASKEDVSDLLQFTLLNIHVIFDVLNQLNSPKKDINKRTQILEREELAETKNPAINAIKNYLNITTTEKIENVGEAKKVLKNCKKLHEAYIIALKNMLKMKLDKEIDKQKVKEFINELSEINIELLCQQRAAIKYNNKPKYLNTRSLNYKTKLSYFTKKNTISRTTIKGKEV